MFRTQTIKQHCNVSLAHYSRVSVRREVRRRAVPSDGLLIQHLSHSEQHLYSWAFLTGVQTVHSYTCRHHRHTVTDTHIRITGPRSDITRHASSCPTLSSHLGKSPGACPATTAWHTHPWKESIVGGGTGWGAKKLWVATVWDWGEKSFWGGG